MKQHIKDILPPTKAELDRHQNATVDRLKSKSLAFGSTLLSESREGALVVLRMQAPTGQVVAVSIDRNGAYTSRLEAARG